jgi:hypothetical protein
MLDRKFSRNEQKENVLYSIALVLRVMLDSQDDLKVKFSFKVCCLPTLGKLHPCESFLDSSSFIYT